MFLLVVSLFGFHGIIEQDTTWSDTAYLTGDVWVNSDVTLTIDPGTVVLYADSCEWDTEWTRESLYRPKSIEEWIDVIVEGNMKVIGTSEDSIWFGDGSGRAGNMILADGVDSLEYVSLKIGRADNYVCIGTGMVNADVLLSHCLFEGGYGILGSKSVLKMKNTELYDLTGMRSYWSGAGTGHLLHFDGGRLYLDSCVIKNGDAMFGPAVYGEDLDTCIINETVIEDMSGFDVVSMPDVGGEAGGCFFSECAYVEVSNSIFRGFGGGSSTGSCGIGFSGASAYGIYIRNCYEGSIMKCDIAGIRGGSGGSASYSDGDGGDAIGLLIWDCSDLTVSRNAITDLSGGQPGPGWGGGESEGSVGAARSLICYNSSPIITNNEFNSAGICIYIDPTSQPVIGGAPGEGNLFIKSEGYAIYNNSPNDIDATWNTWTSPSLIDSLIFDYYDDASKGIVYYDNFTDVEERPTVSEITLGSSLVSGVLHVSNPGGERVYLEFIDITGRKVQSTTILESMATIDVSRLPRGVYFVSARAGESSFIRKMIIY